MVEEWGGVWLGGGLGEGWEWLGCGVGEVWVEHGCVLGGVCVLLESTLCVM